MIFLIIIHDNLPWKPEFGLSGDTKNNRGSWANEGQNVNEMLSVQLSIVLMSIKEY